MSNSVVSKELRDTIASTGRGNSNGGQLVWLRNKERTSPTTVPGHFDLSENGAFEVPIDNSVGLGSLSRAISTSIITTINSDPFGHVYRTEKTERGHASLYVMVIKDEDHLRRVANTDSSFASTAALILAAE